MIKKCETCTLESEYENHFKGKYCTECYFSQLAQLEGENSELRRFKSEILSIIDNSEGVVGWHQNGDVAYWNEFGLEGG